MKNKAVFLDRDGTINVEKNYIYKIEDFTYQEGAKEGMKLLLDAGYLLVIITNQSGIARGYYTEEDYARLDQWMKADLAENEIFIAASYYCPHHPKAIVEKYRKKCKCRKPDTELFWSAIRDLHIEPEKSYAIGDRMRDLQICRESGVRGFLLYSSIGATEAIGRSHIKKLKGGILEAAEDIVS